MKYLLISASLLFLSVASAVTPEFNAYMRAASGSNNRGAAMECYSNKGAAAGNEFRLGNECGIYGEFLLGAHLLKAEDASGPYWKLGSNFAFVYKNSTDFETTDASNAQGGNPNNWVIRELFTEAGYIDGLDFTVWAGKRFYRWGDIHMDDFFSVDMSGPGAGIGGIKTDAGVVSVALIQNSESAEFPGSGAPVTTKNGRAAKTSLHLRLEEMESSLGAWSFWLAGGTTPATTASAGGTEYKSATGGLLAVKNILKTETSTNDFGVAVGQSAMSNLTSRGDLIQDCNNSLSATCTVDQSIRFRVWESYVIDSGRWSAEFAVIYDEYDSGADQDSKVRWTSVGVRPLYWFTDHLSLAFETGISNVVDEGDGLGSRNLIRATLAPQISLGKGYTSRPVIRAFYTYNTWNDNNMVSVASTSAANDTSAHTLGVQTEIWF